MERNVGGYDRVARGVLAAVLAVVGVASVAGVGPGTGAGLLALSGAAGLGSNALSGRCLGNYLLGIDTCGKDC